MSNFLTIDLWFSLYPGPLTPAFRYGLIGLIVIFLLLMLFSWLKQKKVERLYLKLYKSLFSFSMTGIIIGLLMLFFTQQSIPMFSARFWFIIWALLQLCWLYTIIKRLKKLPQLKKEIEAKKEFNKYIP